MSLNMVLLAIAFEPCIPYPHEPLLDAAWIAPSLINQLPPYNNQSLAVALSKFSLNSLRGLSGVPITGKLLILMFSLPKGVRVISSVCSDEATGLLGTSKACILL